MTNVTRKQVFWKIVSNSLHSSTETACTACCFIVTRGLVSLIWLTDMNHFVSLKSCHIVYKYFKVWLNLCLMTITN